MYDLELDKQSNGIAILSSPSRPVLLFTWKCFSQSGFRVLSFQPRWFRYVDDVFSLWHVSRLDYVCLQKPNTLARTIYIKEELEDSGKLLFPAL